jgi:hypothetical protein
MTHKIWTLEEIILRLKEIEGKGYVSIPAVMYRSDEGIVGQILEREFEIQENNLKVGDLGEFELKGMRKNSSTLTLCHRKPETGMNPIQIFERFGYVRPSNRDHSIIKKKLFCTVTGKKFNSLQFKLQPYEEYCIDLYFQDEFICRWNLVEAISKMNNLILIIANTIGKTGSNEEQFHYIRGILYSGLKPINELVNDGKIVIDFCIDQELRGAKGPHDRGPHIRIPKKQLASAYNEMKVIL